MHMLNLSVYKIHKKQIKVKEVLGMMERPSRLRIIDPRDVKQNK